MTPDARALDEQLASGVIEGMGKLDDYLRSNDLTNAAFAQKLGVSEATVSRVRNGKQTPSWDLIIGISTATDGAITPNDFLPHQASA